jgi:fumarate hydratase class II
LANWFRYTKQHEREVVANRAQVIKGFEIGEGEQFIKANDDVNKSQSSNDTSQQECTLLLTAVRS